MSSVLLINLVFFIPAVSGASAFALLVYRFVLRSSEPPDTPGGGSGGAKVPLPSAGPDDLARSA